jgi:hypothetical protein
MQEVAVLSRHPKPIQKPNQREATMEPLQALNQKFGKALHAVAAVSKTQEANAGSYTYKYTDLSTVLKVVKEALAPLELAVSQPIVVSDDGIMSVTTILVDLTTGESLSFPGPGCPVKGDPQQSGSAISYSTPNNRTAAETEIRAWLKDQSKDIKTAFAADFREEFNSSLAELPEGKHGDALAFMKFWDAPDTTETGAV